MARGNNKSAQKPKAKPPSKRLEAAAASSNYVPREVPLLLQQRILKIFRDAFEPEDQDPGILQEVKGHLFNRDFAAAFGKEEYLRIYASRWSPSRALGYVQILVDVHDDLSAGPLPVNEGTFKLVCLGGGAGAEVVAFAGWENLVSSPDKIQAEFVDIAAWDTVVNTLHRAVTTPPELSRYASAAAKEANTALIHEDQYASSFRQLDVLGIDEQQSGNLFQDVDLVTLMFTLNELYSTSMPKTQQVLSQLTSSLKLGAYLLVVDSPGSYSTVSINGAEKKYPMQWLLDYTLVGSQKDTRPKWEKLVSDDSRWFRLPQGLRYPIELENMRYQIHLYRRVDDDGGG